MTRSICHTSMPSQPCYVCEFGLPTGAHLMTVSTVSKHLAPGTRHPGRCHGQDCLYTDTKTDVQHGDPGPDTRRHCSGMFYLRDVRIQDLGPRIHPRRAVLRLPALGDG